MAKKTSGFFQLARSSNAGSCTDISAGPDLEQNPERGINSGAQLSINPSKKVGYYSPLFVRFILPAVSPLNDPN